MGTETQRPASAWGVIWITGAPNVGKSSVADALAQTIRRELRITPVCLDGDLMRLLMDSTDIDTESGRRSLSCVYAQLCANIAKQGHLVIVSVVAMYREAFAELERSLVDNCIVIRLTANPVDLMARDSRGIYSNRTMESLEETHSEVPSYAKVLDTSGKSVPAVVDDVLQFTLASSLLEPSKFYETALDDQISEFGRSRSRASWHWNSYYSTSQVPDTESSFARFAIAEGYIKSEDRVVDFGCGNGRDTGYISKTAPTLGVDSSPEAINRARERAGNSSNEVSLSFSLAQLEELAGVILDFQPTVIYSRFVLHALTAEEEIKFLDHCAESLPVGGRLLIECRSIHDPLALKGTRLSATERVFGHYRRFIRSEEIEESLISRGFLIQFSQTSNGLAQLGQEDPVVTRLAARR